MKKWTLNSLNFNVNFPNLVHMCRYKLPIFGLERLSTGQDIINNFWRLTFWIPYIAFCQKINISSDITSSPLLERENMVLALEI